MRHFYFKFMQGNIGLKEWLKLEKCKIGDEIPLSIYYGKWKKADDWKNKITGFSGLARNQIDTFMELENKEAPIYFWSFYEQYIYLFESKNNKIIDGPEAYNEKDKEGNIASLPKSIVCKLKKHFKKKDLPEVFANINSNQKYNRKTLAELEGVEKEIADYLISQDKNGKMTIKKERSILEYLSPIQFETLIFLIFNTGDTLCSSWRGGTLKDYDLKVKFGTDFKKEGFEEGVVKYLQIKMKDRGIQNDTGDTGDAMIQIHLGNTDEKKKIFGKDWILRKVWDNAMVQKWLEFNLDFFDIR